MSHGFRSHCSYFSNEFERIRLSPSSSISHCQMLYLRSIWLVLVLFDCMLSGRVCELSEYACLNSSFIHWQDTAGMWTDMRWIAVQLTFPEIPNQSRLAMLSSWFFWWTVLTFTMVWKSWPIDFSLSCLSRALSQQHYIIMTGELPGMLIGKMQFMRVVTETYHGPKHRLC